MLNTIHQQGMSRGVEQGNTAVTLRAAERAFSLVEILVVISIMALLASLTVGLIGVVGEKKRVSAATAQIAKLSLLIDTYKEKKGFYPPDHPPTNYQASSLFYELAGATNSGAGFLTPFGFISSADLQTACGVGRILNSASGDAEDRASVQSLITQVSSDETNSIVFGGVRIVVFVGPQGPDGSTVNPIYYRLGSSAANNGISAHNPDSYDLWTVVKTRKPEGKVVGNWKD